MRSKAAAIIAILLSPFIYCQSSVVYNTGTHIHVGTGANVCADTIIVNGTYSGDGKFCDAIVPVELTSFNVNINSALSGSIVELEWETATEVNNYGFVIERAYAEKENPVLADDWVSIGFIQGAGNSTTVNKYIFKDKNPLQGKSFYRLKQMDYDGTFDYSNAVEVVLEMPKEFSISQNYPNPFNPATTIDFTLPAESRVTVSVFNNLGELVSELVNEVKPAGSFKVEFNGSSLASGIYLYRINAVRVDGTENFSVTRKMIMVK